MKYSYSLAVMDNIMSILADRDMTMLDFSRIAGISPSAVTRYSKGERCLTIERIKSFATALNVSVSELIPPEGVEDFE